MKKNTLNYFFISFILLLIALVFILARKDTDLDRDTAEKMIDVPSEAVLLNKKTEDIPEDLKSSTENNTHSQSLPSAQPQSNQPKELPDYPFISITTDLIDQIASSGVGENIEFALPGKLTAHGQLTHIRTGPSGYPVAVEGNLVRPQAGRFFFQKEKLPNLAGPVVGFVLMDDSDLAYKVEPHPSFEARALLKLSSIDNVICRELESPPLDDDDEIFAFQSALTDHPNDIPIPHYQNGVVPLQSIPGATAVLYLDFDGEKGPHSNWGNFNVSPAPDLSVANIFGIWKRVAEDFAPFNLNVTTDLQVYLDAPQNSRQRCIITPSYKASSAAGVAYLGSFNWSGDTPCWSHHTRGRAAAEVISHELGHTLKLRHDGRTGREVYYLGHGSGRVGWKPIMGSGFSRTLSQWSKGEYLHANNVEDDLAIIADQNNNVGFIEDDHGDSSANASPLEILTDNSVKSAGIISHEDDFDVFIFKTRGGQIDLAIETDSSNANLDPLAQLYNEEETLIQFSNPPDTLIARITADLPAGTYTLHISGTGYGNPPNNGYTDYASLGNYKITGTIEGAFKPLRFSIDENPNFDAVIGTVTARNNHENDPIEYSFTSGNESSAFSINSANGTITVADPTFFNYESHTTGFNDPPLIELFVEISNSARPSLNETRRVIVNIEDLNEAPIITQASDILLPERLRIGCKVLQLSLQDPDLYDIHTWSLTSGNDDAIFELNETGLITIANPPDSTKSQNYILEVKVTDSGSPAISTYSNINIEILDVASDNLEPGLIYRATYRNIGGYGLNSLKNHPNYPYNPHETVKLDQINYWSLGDNYGTAIRAYLIAPYTADYTFWIASDEISGLSISTDDNPENQRQIAYLIGRSNHKQYNKIGTQKSSPIRLEAGKAYYIEARHKEATGSDHLAVAWQIDSNGQTLVPQTTMSARFLAPYHLNFIPKISALDPIQIRENIHPGTQITTIEAKDVNGKENHQYTITAGNSEGIFKINPTTGTVYLSENSRLDAETTSEYHLEITLTDHGNPSHTVSTNLTLTILPADYIQPNFIIEEIWNGLKNASFTSLHTDARWPDYPNQFKKLNEFDAVQNISNVYGARIQAYIIPPTTGNYTFYLASDNYGKLFLSTDSTPENATEIVNLPNWVGHKEWDKFDYQSSDAVTLVAGKRYYIEAKFIENSGNDHLTVGWVTPDDPAITVIPGSNLEAYDSNAAPVFSQDSYHFDLNPEADAGTVLGVVASSNEKFETLGHFLHSGDPQKTFHLDPISGELSLVNPDALSPGQVFRLNVLAQDDGYGGYLPLKSTFVPVSVQINGTPLQTWRGQHFGIDINNEALAGDFMDPDEDSIINLMEYALNLDPLNYPKQADLPHIESKNGALYYIYRKNIKATDLDYSIEQTNNLTSPTTWNPVQIIDKETISDDGSTQIIRATLPEPESTQSMFLKLKVEIK